MAVACCKGASWNPPKKSRPEAPISKLTMDNCGCGLRPRHVYADWARGEVMQPGTIFRPRVYGPATWLVYSWIMEFALMLNGGAPFRHRSLARAASRSTSPAPPVLVSRGPGGHVDSWRKASMVGRMYGGGLDVGLPSGEKAPSSAWFFGLWLRGRRFGREQCFFRHSAPNPQLKFNAAQPPQFLPLTPDHFSLTTIQQGFNQ